MPIAKNTECPHSSVITSLLDHLKFQHWACEQKKKQFFSQIYSHCIRGIMFFYSFDCWTVSYLLVTNSRARKSQYANLALVISFVFISTLDCMMYATANCIIYLSEFIASNLKQAILRFVFNKHCLQLRLKCVLYAWFSIIPNPQRPSATSRFTFFHSSFFHARVKFSPFAHAQ